MPEKFKSVEISKKSRAQRARREEERSWESGAALDEERRADEMEILGENERAEKAEIEKKAEGLFGEKEKELKEKIDKSRTFQGERLSPSRTHEEMLKFYLTDLGYSVKYTALHGKARILDEKGEYVLDKKTKKPREFKTSFDPKGETPIIQFLKEELKNKIRKDSGVGESESKEEEKKEKKPFKFLESLKKAAERMADSIKKGAKKMAVLGLTPAAAMEDFGQRIFSEPKKFFEKIKAMEGAGEAMEKEDKEELNRIFTSYTEKVKQIEEQKKKKSKIWELIKKIRI